MIRWYSSILFLLAGACFTGCITPYEPAILAEGNNYLVVEGYLSTNSSTTIRLTRTAALSNKEEIRAVSEAEVLIEGQSGNIYGLVESAEGVYTAPQLELDPLDQYRLNIVTKEGKQYLSEFVPLKSTPPIQRIDWEQKSDNNLYIRVNTEDPQQNTWYYKWDFEEAWEWIVYLKPEVIYVNGKMIYYWEEGFTLPPSHCWGQEKSKGIYLASSLKYGRDIITDHVLTVIPWTSWKLSTRYTILVKQYALSQEAFEYFRQMKKNGEAVGSLFDPLPTELPGNIYAVDNPDEPVIGFFSGGAVQEQRIYINNSDLNHWPLNMYCQLDTVHVSRWEAIFGKKLMVPVYHDTTSVKAMGTPDIYCVDCTVLASPVKPDFWE